MTEVIVSVISIMISDCADQAKCSVELQNVTRLSFSSFIIYN